MWVLFLFNQSKMVLYAQFLGIGIDMPQISRSALVPLAQNKCINSLMTLFHIRAFAGVWVAELLVIVLKK